MISHQQHGGLDLGQRVLLVRTVQLLFAQLVHVVTQKPVVRAELLASSGHYMGLVHDQQADGTVTDQVGDIAAAQQGLRRKIDGLAQIIQKQAVGSLFQQPVSACTAHSYSAQAESIISRSPRSLP